MRRGNFCDVCDLVLSVLYYIVLRYAMLCYIELYYVMLHYAAAAAIAAAAAVAADPPPLLPLMLPLLLRLLLSLLLLQRNASMLALLPSGEHARPSPLGRATLRSSGGGGGEVTCPSSLGGARPHHSKPRSG